MPATRIVIFVYQISMQVKDLNLSFSTAKRLRGVPLAQLRTFVDLVPRFGTQAKRQLAKEMILKYRSKFWLNKYREPFYAFKGI